MGPSRDMPQPGIGEVRQPKRSGNARSAAGVQGVSSGPCRCRGAGVPLDPSVIR